MQELVELIKQTAKKLYGVDITPELSRPEEKFGDYSSNAALQLGAHLGKPPKEVAQAIIKQIQSADGIQTASVAGPGFINISLSDQKLVAMLEGATKLETPLLSQEILVEFGDPNPFKEMHIGHLYSSIIGDAISALLQASGAKVRRLSYHGDVGLHVARAIWGMQTKQAGLTLGEYYAAGAKAFDEDAVAKSEIQAINGHIYRRDSPEINELYKTGRAQSLKEFDKIYKSLGIDYDRHYFESESSAVGLKFVHENPNVFKKSEGALIFDGEKIGLHTRVFITSKGLPTYETKDLGLAELKNRDYPKATRSIIVTANEQAEYFKVMLAALEQVDLELAQKTTHLTHGFVNLSTGKMSSRTGDVYAAADLLVEVNKATQEQYPDSTIHKEVALGAIKYSFAKHRIGQDVTFDIKESVSLEGNSGPYLQYAHARACSILAKSTGETGKLNELEPDERSLARKITEYPEVLTKATAELMPHLVATYLYELAQSFNRFYEKNRVIGDRREAQRLSLVKSYCSVINNGLELLGVSAPDRM